MTTTKETPLIELLKGLDRHMDDLVLSDGATDWAVDNLICALRNADELDTAEYAIDGRDGPIKIVRLEAGYRTSPAIYTQVFGGPTKAAKRKIDISGNWRPGGPDREWAGTGTVDQDGSIECSANLEGNAYEQIEEQIEDGETSGSVTVTAEDGREVTYHWGIEG